MREPSGTAGRVLDRRVALAGAWDDLVEQVRALGPEHRDFLRPPSVTGLLPPPGPEAAVLVNLTATRCDALVLTAAGVTAVPLPGLSLAAANDLAERHLAALHELQAATAALDRAHRRAELRPGAAAYHALHATRLRFMAAQSTLDTELTDAMAWLWEAVAEPVLTVAEPVQSVGDAPARVWWCPTGPLSFLPLHAAGFHDGSGRSVLDRVVSSYTPTLRALAEARRTARNDPGGTGDRVLVVAVPEPPGEVPLPQVSAEVDVLRRLVPADRLTVLDGPAATREAVLSALAEHSWVHFSCHGRQQLGDPSSGGLLLHDGSLTVVDLARGRHAGAFGFLSACQTATGGLRLTDEALTLAASLHFTGFRHVVATLWSVDADVALDMTEAVYSTLVVDGRLEPRRAASAVHSAVLGLRAVDPQRPSQWALFTHTGP